MKNLFFYRQYRLTQTSETVSLNVGNLYIFSTKRAGRDFFVRWYKNSREYFVYCRGFLWNITDIIAADSTVKNFWG